MSTNHTTNYNLCQWEATDQVQRTDFNQDNAKIDAALASRLGPVEIIKTVTLSTASDQDDLTMDLTDVNWDQWSLVLVELRCTFSNSIEEKFVYLSLGGASFAGHTGTSFAYRLPPGPILMALFPSRDASRLVTALSFPGGDTGLSAATYSQIQNIQVLSNQSSLHRHITGVGSLTLYGIH